MEFYSDVEVSETNTENLFRGFYGSSTFIEKSAISDVKGFISKQSTGYKGYPDFFYEESSFAIVVECKALEHSSAEEEVKWYMLNNNIHKNIVGIAISGQEISQVKLTYFYLKDGSDHVGQFNIKDKFVPLNRFEKILNKHIVGDTISTEELVQILKKINETFNDNNVKDTERSLLFSGMLIALSDSTFRGTYSNIEKPTTEELATTSQAVPSSLYMSESMLNAIDRQLSSKVNNLSKRISWLDQFSFIKNIDFSLEQYKEILDTIRTKIYIPFQKEEKQDILGKAYKIFLSRSGKIDNKNIILTPDHVKELMIKLAQLNLDDVVLDTCTGTGGFLMEAMEKLNNLAQDDEDVLKDIRENKLIGFEIDATLFSLACSNMFLHGDGRSNMLFRSSLLETDGKQKFINQKDQILFDYIKSKKVTKCIINPPYEADNPIKFAKQAIDYLEPNGKLIAIMPSPTLTKNQKGNENSVTADLLRNARLDFVIKMPLNIFNEQGRTVNTSIFGFTKTMHREDDEVLFYNLLDDGLVSVQHKGRIDKFNKWNDIENKILNTIRNSKEIENLSQKKLIFKNGELNAAGFPSLDNSQHNLVKIKDVFSARKGTLASTQASFDGEYTFVTAADEWKKSDYADQKGPALVFATGASGSLGKSQYVTGEFVASNLCYVLKGKDAIKYPVNLKFYNWYFSGIREQLVHDLADGTSKLTISIKALEEYYIEYVPISEQDEFVKDFVDKYDELKNEKERAEKELVQRINGLI